MFSSLECFGKGGRIPDSLCVYYCGRYHSAIILYNVRCFLFEMERNWTINFVIVCNVLSIVDEFWTYLSSHLLCLDFLD